MTGVAAILWDGISSRPHRELKDSVRAGQDMVIGSDGVRYELLSGVMVLGRAGYNN